MQYATPDATALGAADAAGASDATGFGVGSGVRKPPFPSTRAFRKISTKTAITPMTMPCQGATNPLAGVGEHADEATQPGEATGVLEGLV